ncbi:hypothetical protein [Litoribacillus peritrichatus]|uniref:Immunity protein 30 domain-containing protein n=1 Tax=Litoribacillus peritrichatus TaxID=718191 RepID=A0ABP7MDM5_9GAMM
MADLMEEKVRNIDWVKYSGPEHFDPDELVEALILLSRNDESRAVHGLDNKVLFAVGNNHAGTYYPAILGALEILIELEKQSTNLAVRKCSFAILNDLFYFTPELGSYQTHTEEELEKIVKERLRDYEDKS